ncbi:MAG: apolipoprotein N-acyltransferase [Gloeobacteraceae cyanobacterium ES-bin-144]|nr:apolipoprotein N-acyltransferase [Verrucomicrobiales bacterium]
MKLAAAVLSGLLVAGCFPPYGMSALMWVAMIPLLAALWSIHGKRAGWKGFGLGWLAGTVSCLIQFSWLSSVTSLGAMLLPMYLGIYWGLFGAFAASLGNPWRANGGKRALSVALGHGAVWAGLEWLRGWLLTGFGWNGLGVAFHDTPWVAQAADLLGVGGLSLMAVFFQAVVVQFATRRSWIDLGVAAAAVGLLVTYGVVRIGIERRAESIPLKTLLVQINIPQDAAQVLWSALDVHMAYEEETRKALESLKVKGAEHWPDWVMWPECALTGRILRTADGTWGMWQENEQTIMQVREVGEFHLIYGVNELEAVKTDDGQLMVKDKARMWNSIAAMTPDNQLQTYRKHHLVIFGETIPLVNEIPLLKKIYEWQAGVEYGGSFTAGESLEPLMIPNLAGTMIGAIPTVCFEDSVPRLTRKFVRPGPQVIVNVTNDGWFKQTAAAAQHFANARFRAIELRRPMLRCANSGVSAAIDSTGSTDTDPASWKSQVLVDEKGSHFTRGSLLTELKIPRHPSFSLYALIGDWGIIVLALAAFILSWRNSKDEVS